MLLKQDSVTHMIAIYPSIERFRSRVKEGEDNCEVRETWQWPSYATKQPREVVYRFQQVTDVACIHFSSLWMPFT